MKAIVTVNVTKDLHVLTATSIVPADTEFNNTVEPPVPPTPNKPPHNPLKHRVNLQLTHQATT